MTKYHVMMGFRAGTIYKVEHEMEPPRQKVSCFKGMALGEGRGQQPFIEGEIRKRRERQTIAKTIRSNQGTTEKLGRPSFVRHGNVLKTDQATIVGPHILVRRMLNDKARMVPRLAGQHFPRATFRRMVSTLVPSST